MMRKKELAFWTFLLMTGLAAATTLLNVTRTYSATSQNSDLYRQLDLFGDVLERVRSDYVEKPDDNMLIESAINGMLAALDPHSSYMNPKQYREMQVQTTGEFGGLGIEVTMENGVIKVVSPIDDTPAAKAGLLANDLITHIDNEQIVGLTLQQAVDKMRGRSIRRSRSPSCARALISRSTSRSCAISSVSTLSRRTRRATSLTSRSPASASRRMPI
jgi:carboxyl-terminal processing protease